MCFPTLKKSHIQHFRKRTLNTKFEWNIWILRHLKNIYKIKNSERQKNRQTNRKHICFSSLLESVKCSSQVPTRCTFLGKTANITKYYPQGVHMQFENLLIIIFFYFLSFPDTSIKHWFLSNFLAYTSINLRIKTLGMKHEYIYKHFLIISPLQSLEFCFIFYFFLINSLLCNQWCPTPLWDFGKWYCYGFICISCVFLK